MSDHKPLSDEELNELAVDTPDGSEVACGAEYWHRLISQARDANRLREGGAFRAGAEAFKRAALENEEARLKRELYNGTHVGTAESWRQNYTCRYVELPTEDPAARAKRELGEWLAADYRYRSAKLQEHGDRFRVHLIRGGYDNVTGPWCATEHEAITAALKAARESGR